MDLDLLARRTLAAALAYYSLDIALLSDAEFDLGCKRLQDEWEGLSEFRQWQLGPREEVTVTGYHYKATLYSASGALSWALKDGKAQASALWFNQKPRWSGDNKVAWWPVGAFQWDQTALL